MILFTEKADELKNYNSTQNAFLPRKVNIPLCEEYNIVCEPLVKPGDTVREGQIIATPAKNDRVNIHASIPGIVEDIVDVQSPNAKTGKSIQIALKGSFDFLGRRRAPKTPASLSPSQIEDAVFSSGIINTFNTKKPCNLGKQLKDFSGTSLVVRLFDEDPSCMTDRLISKFFLPELLTASEYLFKTLGARNTVFACNPNLTPKSEFESYKQENTYFLEESGNDYPNGFKEKIISAFNKNPKFKDSGVKLSKNDLFCDASTLKEVYDCVTNSLPAINKLVHFSGNCLKSSGLLNVKVGTSIRDVISQIGGMVKNPRQIIINGYLHGSTAGTLDMPVTRYVKSVYLVTKKNALDSKVYNCINCGSCRAVCKSHVFPDVIYNHVVNFNTVSLYKEESAQNVDKLLKSMVAKCVDCASCNMVCPSRLPLTQIINMLRDGYENE